MREIGRKRTRRSRRVPRVSEDEKSLLTIHEREACNEWTHTGELTHTGTGILLCSGGDLINSLSIYRDG